MMNMLISLFVEIISQFMPTANITLYTLICTNFICQLYLRAWAGGEKEIWCKGKSEGSSLGHSLSIRQGFHVIRGSTRYKIAKALWWELLYPRWCEMPACRSLLKAHGLCGVSIQQSERSMEWRVMPLPPARLWKKGQDQVRRLGPIFRRLGFLNSSSPEGMWYTEGSIRGFAREVIRNG